MGLTLRVHGESPVLADLVESTGSYCGDHIVRRDR